MPIHRRPRLAFALFILFIGRRVDGQDVFSSGTQRSTCEEARAAVERKYYTTMAELQKKDDDLAREKTRTESNCGTGDQAKDCKTNAHIEYERGHDDIQVMRNRADAARKRDLNRVDRGECSASQVKPDRRPDNTYSRSDGAPPRKSGGTPEQHQPAAMPDEGTCAAVPFDVRADVPEGDPSLRYTLGFERGFAGCLEKQYTDENLSRTLATAALLGRFKELAGVLALAAAPDAIDGVLHPPGASRNPNPYLRGNDEGSRLCEWALKESVLLVPRCKGSMSMSGGGKEPTGPRRNPKVTGAREEPNNRSSIIERAAPPTKVVEDGFGGFKATWSNDPKAYVHFEPRGRGVNVADIVRGNQPARSAGQMLADSLKRAGIAKPATIRFSSIHEERTVEQLSKNVPVEQTTLGNTMRNAVRELGGTIGEWKAGTFQEKPYIEVTVTYP